MNDDKEPTGLQSAVTATLIGHICIRDPDTGEIIVRQRDITFEKTDHD